MFDLQTEKEMCSKFEGIYLGMTLSLISFFSVIMPPSALDQLGRYCLRPNKKISVFRGNWSEILGRVGTHIFF